MSSNQDSQRVGRRTAILDSSLASRVTSPVIQSVAWSVDISDSKILGLDVGVQRDRTLEYQLDNRFDIVNQGPLPIVNAKLESLVVTAEDDRGNTAQLIDAPSENLGTLSPGASTRVDVDGGQEYSESREGEAEERGLASVLSRLCIDGPIQFEYDMEISGVLLSSSTTITTTPSFTDQAERSCPYFRASEPFS